MTQSYAFTKMHALGNDFIVINNLNKNFPLGSLKTLHLGNRHLGIGFDQALIIEPSQQADFYCRIVNTDGSEAEQCGNGLRCVAAYLKAEGLFHNAHVSIETKAGCFPIQDLGEGRFEVNMGKPQSLIQAVNLSVHQQLLTAYTVSLGNPHAILTHQPLTHDHIEMLGQAFNQHPHFPQGVNVGFLEKQSDHHAILRTFERGAGQTLACGSNACAAAVVGIHEGWLSSPVTIQFTLGDLTIAWEGAETPIRMAGPTTRVFEGVITC